MNAIRDWFLSLTLVQAILVFLTTWAGLWFAIRIVSWFLTPDELPCDC